MIKTTTTTFYTHFCTENTDSRTIHLPSWLLSGWSSSCRTRSCCPSGLRRHRSSRGQGHTPSPPGSRDTAWCYTGLCTDNLGNGSDLRSHKAGHAATVEKCFRQRRACNAAAETDATKCFVSQKEKNIQFLEVLCYKLCVCRFLHSELHWQNFSQKF